MFNLFYHSPLLNKFFPTLVHCLKKELADCETVLDLGCGADSPLKHCKNIKYSLGVEAFGSYLEKTKQQKIHNEYWHKKIEEIDLPAKSFDAVILIEVLEHLSKEQGYEILKKAEKWAKKKIIFTTPNGFIAQNEIAGNKLEKHISDWNYAEIKKLGFKVNGLAGLKYLRQERPGRPDDNLLSSIRFKPKLFWFMLAALSQAMTYRWPKLAFEFFALRTQNTKTPKHANKLSD
ncbi:MAG: Methyltransferase type 11 [Candidatus Kuenenbacteria bacterium GW2011_GWA2_42_15]|uniref:Methyltransferase type 11 n=1 Tax=Candidatus Kuenenbacteria bacterium GW2011_GWA2_42_15 TaxID=1618677 RepID=A0A0G1B7W5_9BACT|nr:MAG: Methyltransferase type 11 [Candidatus Kuenenbacteria bacterium GW2011_GWA2_42_15]